MMAVRSGGLMALAMLLAACGGGGDAGGGDDETATPDSGGSAVADAAASGGEPAGTPAAATGAAGQPPAAYAQCRTCHSVEPGKHGIGPSLAGVYGTRAGEIEGFRFSKAMLESGLTWDDATLDAYLEDPRKTVPGTKMAFFGLKDPAKRQAVIDYIKTLK